MAISAYRECVKLDKTDGMAITQLTLSLHGLHRETGLTSQACKEMRELAVAAVAALKLSSGSNDALVGKASGFGVLMGDILGSCGFWSDAKSAYTASVNGWNPAQGTFLPWLGGMKGSAGTTPHCRLGVATATLGDHAGAVKLFKKALKLGDPMAAEVHGYLGFAYSQMGEGHYAKTEKHLKRSLELAGLHPSLVSPEEWDIKASIDAAPGDPADP